MRAPNALARLVALAAFALPALFIAPRALAHDEASREAKPGKASKSGANAPSGEKRYEPNNVPGLSQYTETGVEGHAETSGTACCVRGAAPSSTPAPSARPARPRARRHAWSS